MSKKEENKSFAPEFRENANSEWSGCEERYKTEAEALAQARALAKVAGLLGYDGVEYRATPSTDPVNATFDLTQTA